MAGIPYPPRNSIITFREPFPRKNENKYYIKVAVDEMPEMEIRIDSKQQKDVMDYLILVDKKLTNAVVRNDNQGRFVVEKHSPASDFFYLIDNDKK